MSTKLLNRRQARWSEFLSRFDFKIIFQPQKSGGKPDALTRRSGDLSMEGDERLVANQQAVLKPWNLSSVTTSSNSANGLLQILADNMNEDPENAEDLENSVEGPENAMEGPDNAIEDVDNLDNTGKILTLLEEAYQVYPFPERILRLLRDDVQQCKEISLADCKEKNGRLVYRDCIYVPDHMLLRLRLLQNQYDPPVIGHPGRTKTFELLSRQYYWPVMRKDVDQFVCNSNVCHRTKVTRHAPYGMLRLLSVPDRSWQHISVDFVTGLLPSKQFDAICVEVDRLTKQRHLIPCKTTITAEELAQLFCDRVFHYYGLLKTIVSDRGPQFASHFWKHLCHSLKIKPRLSTAFHPQMDGQTERINAAVEQHLRAYVSYLQDDWVDYLFLAEFAGNNQVLETTTVSPFFANLGCHPHCDFELDIRADNAEEQQVQTAVERIQHIHDLVETECDMHRPASKRMQTNTIYLHLPFSLETWSGLMDGIGTQDDQAGS